MAELNNNELDDLFREGSELQEFSYRADAWDSMEGMLDRQDRKKRALLLLLLFTLGVLIIGSFFYFSGKKKSQTAFTDDAIAKSEIIQKHIDQNQESNPDINIIEQKGKAISKAEVSVVDEKKENVPVSVKTQSTNKYNSANTQKAKSPDAFTSDNQILNKNNSTKIQAPIITADDDEKNKLVATTATKESKINLPGLRLNSIQDRPVFKADNEHIFPLTNLEEKVNTTKISPWSFGVSAGPEISLVGMETKPKFGYSVGIEVAYQFHSKFSLKTGIGYSAKNYIGLGTDYSTPDGFWTDDIVPLTVEATCQVFEVPFAISYFKNGMNHTGFFADLGINAYLIGDEWYDYNYDPGINNPSLRLSFNEHMSNKRILGSIQVAIGYQKILSEKWRIQVSPYAKIPLNGFGHGQVKLFSQGIKLSAWFTN